MPSGEDSIGVPGVQAFVPDAVGVFFDFVPVLTSRIAGADRVATAIAVAQKDANASTVLLATSLGFADALVGAPLATHLEGPLLLTAPSELDPACLRRSSGSAPPKWSCWAATRRSPQP